MLTNQCAGCGRSLTPYKLSEKRKYCTDRCKVAHHRELKNPSKHAEVCIKPTLNGEGFFYLTDHLGRVVAGPFKTIKEFLRTHTLTQSLIDPRKCEL